MRILFNNVDFSSSSGPNSFGLKLARQLQKTGHDIVSDNPDVSLNFIQGHVPGMRNVLRLDGIYFNTTQDWKQLNDPIKKSYDLADAVVVQSEFNRKLVTQYFGQHKSMHVVHNGTDLETIKNMPSAAFNTPRNKTWLCASFWRPHKRLGDNARYFQRFAGDDDILFVAGTGDVSDLAQTQYARDPRILYLGELSWQHLIAAMKSSKHFVHMSYLDHCPNVVVDARACGCTIHCASSGGTHEIAGINASIVNEPPWNFEPHDLYDPPPLDFDLVRRGLSGTDIDIVKQAEKYERILRNDS